MNRFTPRHRKILETIKKDIPMLCNGSKRDDEGYALGWALEDDERAHMVSKRLVEGGPITFSTKSWIARHKTP